MLQIKGDSISHQTSFCDLFPVYLLENHVHCVTVITTVDSEDYSIVFFPLLGSEAGIERKIISYFFNGRASVVSVKDVLIPVSLFCKQEQKGMLSVLINESRKIGRHFREKQ